MRYAVSEADHQWAARVWDKLAIKLKAECQRIGPIMPYISANGAYEDMAERNLVWWTNGFWGGILWQMYHATKDDVYKETAEQIEARLDQGFTDYMGLDHDLGFLWLHTAVADYRLTRNEQSRIRGLHAAGILAGRFQPAGEYIRAWNEGHEGIAIVDCLMNLPLLYWAADQRKDTGLKQIAMKHADMALQYVLRPDGSCNHLVKFDTETGEYLDNPGGQGYESGSSWTRGQSWAIYGMALSYRYTQKQEYLDAAKRSAHYFIANTAVNDYEVVIDFRSPEEPVYYDTTAAVCAACGLLELSEFVGEYEKGLYIKSAVRLLRKIDEKFCEWNPDLDSIVSHGSAKYHRESDREVPIIYGDYFFLEAILRLLNRDFLIW
ncbi:glycosyl hydrolase family 88 [Paenibacillus sp. LMG 31459]|uniref:Glycosyl hydrolase family 88 n=1 Tax=Paenibacillus phytohabitans TaxID=2654978 RepID=A0ABX1YG73_9BACL|nr:glycoside hydrolase family 88 protein [Paenibacillus phytohabitans]NOU79469.1 glycosyl hydrolase family 88 [Paenibacillus phytohabitans]